MPVGAGAVLAQLSDWDARVGRDATFLPKFADRVPQEHGMGRGRDHSLGPLGKHASKVSPM